MLLATVLQHHNEHRALIASQDLDIHRLSTMTKVSTAKIPSKIIIN